MKNCVLVKICGNCNPGISIKKLLQELKESTDRYIFTPSYEGKCNLLLIINTCMSDCIHPHEFDGHIIIVSGYRVDYVDCTKEELVSRIITLLDRYTEGKKYDMYKRI